MYEHVFHALADKQRRFILSLLKTRDMNVSEIRVNMDISGATLSHHLDILKRANLVQSERKGKHVFYSLNTSVFEEVLSHLTSFFSP